MSRMINDVDFKTLSEYIYQNCGIVLKEDKKYLINNRLDLFLDLAGFKDFTELSQKLHTLSTEQKQSLISKVTTNETFFFRDVHPFKVLREDIFPRIIETHKAQHRNSIVSFDSKIKIWSLASSTGQEAYSIAMDLETLCEGSMNIKYHDFQILGTDISHDVLAKAKAGIYTDLELKRGLSPDQLQKFFITSDGKTQIAARLKSIISFEYLNLVDLPTYFTSNFDLILCRNVLIYFDHKTKEKILDYIYQKLGNSGYLIVGASESLYGLKHNFKSQKIGNTLLYFK